MRRSSRAAVCSGGRGAAEDFSLRLDREADPYEPFIYPPPACWPALSAGRALRLLRRRRRGGRVMLKLAVPFCSARCGLCRLSLAPSAAALARYARALRAEMRSLAPEFSGDVFFSLRVEGNLLALEPGQLREVLGEVRRRFSLAPGCKFGAEMNPAFMTAPRLRAAAEQGVKWAVVCGQSLEPAALAAAGCAHAPGALIPACVLARRCGLPFLSVDLMTGLPGQTPAGFVRGLGQVLKLRPERIAVYAWSGARDARAAAALAEKGFALMRSAGYRFRDGFSPYWGVLDERLDAHWPHAYETGSPEDCYSVLALGAGARTYLEGAARWANPSGPEAYCRRCLGGRLPAEKGTALGQRDEMVNFMLLALDCQACISAAVFRRRFGRSPEQALGAALRRLLRQGIIKPAPGGYALAADRRSARHAARRAFFPRRLAGFFGGSER